jgi:hypothetical protein
VVALERSSGVLGYRYRDCNKPTGGFSHWPDARTLPGLLTDLRTAPDANSDQIIRLGDAIEVGIHDLLGSNLGPDDLGQLIEVIDNNDSVIWQILASDVVDAIPRIIDNVHD